MKKTANKLYAFQWNQGGYNSVFAANRQEAIEKANANSCGLTVNPVSLCHSLAAELFLRRMDLKTQGMFD